MQSIHLALLAISLIVITAYSTMANTVAPVPQTQAAAGHLNPLPFGLWLDQLKKDAIAQGIKPALFDQAFAGMEPDSKVIELDRSQPEGRKSFTDYLFDTVSDTRIMQGQQKMAEYAPLLERVGRDYQVQPRFIVALWGKETNYGGFSGNSNIIRSLATLAYDGRRSDFFRTELLLALKIVQDNHISLENMKGSWAGAMGQCQFMPSSFVKYAVDYNKDGRIDIWNSPEDIFASIANYLKQSGWNNQQTWGRQVIIPQGFDMMLTDGKHWKTLSEWNALGVTNPDGTPLPQEPLLAAVTIPGKPRESAYIVYKNYDIILQWNKSRYFATAVGKLSDQLGGV